MNPKEAFKFCTRCGGNLALNGENLLVCQKCGFKCYINPLPCNAVVIENEKEEILLVKRKFDPRKGHWDWPGGFIDPGEDFEHSVKREIKEELGVDIEVGKIIGVYDDIYIYQEISSPTLCIVVAAKISKGEIKVSDDAESYRFFSKDEVLNLEFAFPSIKNGLLDYLKLKNNQFPS